MPELIRSAVSAVRLYFKDRRQSPRLRIRLLFSLSIHWPVNGNGNGRCKPGEYLRGHTRNISADGLALLVPQVHLDGYHLAAESRQLFVRLECGGQAPINVIVEARRYEQLEEPELGCGYLIGAEIVHLDDIDRGRYLHFIDRGLAGEAV